MTFPDRGAGARAVGEQEEPGKPGKREIVIENMGTSEDQRGTVNENSRTSVASTTGPFTVAGCKAFASGGWQRGRATEASPIAPELSGHYRRTVWGNINIQCLL